MPDYSDFRKITVIKVRKELTERIIICVFKVHNELDKVINGLIAVI